MTIYITDFIRSYKHLTRNYIRQILGIKYKSRFDGRVFSYEALANPVAAIPWAWWCSQRVVLNSGGMTVLKSEVMREGIKAMTSK